MSLQEAMIVALNSYVNFFLLGLEYNEFIGATPIGIFLPHNKSVVKIDKGSYGKKANSSHCGC